MKGLAFLAAILLSSRPALSADPKPDATKLRGILLGAEQVSEKRLRRARTGGVNAIVLELKDRSSGADRRAQDTAIERIRDAGLDLHYWIEIARHPKLADEHPKWMASLQGHKEWRRFFKDLPLPKENEIVKAYPWVPILYKEAFEAHLARVKRLLDGKPRSKGIFLNDLQGAPSACGCGHPLCRWTADYGPIRTATTLGDDAAARFTEAVKKLAPQARVIPVWATECEQHDGAAKGLCAGVGCFKGICWKAFSRQLDPLAREAKQLAVLLAYKEFQRDLPIYGAQEAAWVKTALESFQGMPPKRGGKPVAADRLIAVLQGWNVSEREIEAQIERAREAGAHGYIVSELEIEQGWEPRLVRWK